LCTTPSSLAGGGTLRRPLLIEVESRNAVTSAPLLSRAHASTVVSLMAWKLRG
jgi:hypothetical protein